jgi:hypothetical protein
MEETHVTDIMIHGIDIEDFKALTKTTLP